MSDYTLYPTGKQQEILDFIYKYRFVNSIQIQKVLKHKDRRRINSWLKQLVDYKYLGRIYSHKLLENTKPAIYYLSYTGIAYIREKKKFEPKEVKKFYEDKNKSKTFINHCLSIVDIMLERKKSENSTEYVYEFFPKEVLTKHQYLKEIKPDLYFEIHWVKKNVNKKRYFVDLFDAHVPGYALRYRVKQYIEFRDSYEWRDFGNGSKFPYVFFILPNQQKLNRLAKHIQETLDKSYDVEDMVFMLTTHEKVIKEGLAGDIWKVQFTEELDSLL